MFTDLLRLQSAVKGNHDRKVNLSGTVENQISDYDVENNNIFKIYCCIIIFNNIRTLQKYMQ